jgi:DNA-binding FrmR family transcriptional regulator
MEYKDIKKNNTQSNKIINRLSRVEGQIRGVRKMIEEKKDCLDIMNQITAIKEAVAMLGIEFLKDDFICKQKDHKAISYAYIKTLLKAK